MEEERRQAKLNRAKLAIKNGTAYDSSDDEDYGFGGGGFGDDVDFDFGGRYDKDDGGQEDSDSDDSICISDLPFVKEVKEEKKVKEESLKKAMKVVEELEKENNAQVALVDHNKAIAESVLKEKVRAISTCRMINAREIIANPPVLQDITVKKGKKRAKLKHNQSSYAKGKTDSKDIDLDQNAIKGV
jgi:hypothetical protein